ncbi:MAG: agmatinase [Planctomycetota bacterium]
MSASFRTNLPNARVTPRFAGIPTCCRVPRLEDVTPEHLPVDWLFYGIPFDGGVTFRPGAKFGPRAIREASQYIKPYHLEHDVNIARVLSMADAGDAPVDPYSCEQTLKTSAAHAIALAEPSHTKLFAIGGDHSIAYANIKATWERRGRPSGGLALLHFDAHLDTADVVWGAKWTHASPFIRAIEDGLIDPKRMLSLGIRGPLNTETDLDYAREHGIDIVRADQVFTEDGQRRIDAFLKRLGHDETYLTFDIDCVDPAYAPGTGTPCCGGFTSTEAMTLLRRCAGVNLVGADLVEVLPDRDVSDITALLASHVIAEVLALAALHTRG